MLKSKCKKCGAKSIFNCKYKNDCGLKVKRPDVEMHKPKQKVSMGKIVKFIRNTVSGENKMGELVHGLADLLPIPNQAIAKALKALFSGNIEGAKYELPNIFTTRNIVATLASVAYLAGWITLEDVKNLVESLSSILSS